MQWSELFDATQQPSIDQIEDYINSPLWNNLNDHLLQTYNVKPKLEYSGCSMDGGIWMGWNVKYKKGGKSLCTLYPKQGHLLLLVPVGISEMVETELLMPTCQEYTQKLFSETKTGHNGKSLAFEVKSEDVFNDVKNLMAIRVQALKTRK
ncbi:MAG: DUF3788 domain-containing protein [Defluviitaleaceae bacterium]|nr:DUF3788 domain-containing protein [Defluviitaleaceae bacterium]